jgi:formate dehydrogenase major subunit
MALVKLEIDGKRVIADGAQTILAVARQNGIHGIPTLCDDGQLEPFASCFLCVVKVRGARTLLPACSTKVTPGMAVETDTPEVRRSRKAALELLLSNHYADCVGPCQLSCPAGIDIQGYVALAALGRHEDAIRLIKDKNPLPAVCGRVCTRPCEVKGCRRNLLDEPVGIDFIKRYVADLDLMRANAWRPAVEPPRGKRVAIVGAGPAGLSCAYYLAVRGYAVHLLESQPQAGGMLRYGIPEYRLPKEVLDLEVAQILDLGVKLSTNVWLGKDFTISSLKAEGFDAIFLGIGAWDSSKMRVPDEATEGVLAGIDFLRTVAMRRRPAIHGKVMVVGGGNTAIDCARTALRLGATEVRLLYRRTRDEMPANLVEIEEAEHEGVTMEFLAAPTRVLKTNGRLGALECIRMELGERDASGRRSPKPVRGSEHTVPCDFVLAAIGQGTKVAELVDGRVPSFLPLGESLGLTRWQTVQVAEGTFETSVDGLFAGGDVVTGAATAIEAIAAGRKAAYAIDRYIATGKAAPEPQEFVSRKDAFAKVGLGDLRSREKSERRPMPSLSGDERQRSFAEVEIGYSPADLRAETLRCQECGCSALFRCDLRRYASEYGVDLSTFQGEAKRYPLDTTHPLIELDPNKCILCGRCVRMCSEVVGVAAYGFVGRGFETMVRPALGGRLLDGGCISCGLCVETCPTGAIAAKSMLVKSGPWRTTTAPTVCSYCGVGCRLSHEVYGGTLIGVSRLDEGPPTHGNHCRKGRFGAHYVQSPERLLRARIRPGREQQEATIDEAVQFAGLRLRDATRRLSGKEIAVFVSPRLTNEEIYLAQKLARGVLGTNHIGSFGWLSNPELFCPEILSTASYRDLADVQTILLVNATPEDENLVLDLLMRGAIRKGANLLHVGAATTRLSRAAEVDLRCVAGSETHVVLGMLQAFVRLRPDALGEHPELAQLLGSRSDHWLDGTGVEGDAVQQAAEILARSVIKVMLFNRDHRGPRVPGDERILARAGEALGCSLLAAREKSNQQGLLDMGAHPSWLPGYASLDDAAAVDAFEKQWCVVLREFDRSGPDLAEALGAGQIKAVVVLGEDPLGAPNLPEAFKQGLLAADLLVVADLFLTRTAQAAHAVLPLSTLAETSGTLTNLERRVQRVERAIPARTGVENWQLLCRLAAALGHRFRLRYGSAAEITEEIRRVVPIYRDVVVGSGDEEGIWDASRLALPRVALPPSLVPAIPSASTLELDCIELRFRDWFDGLVQRARADSGVASIRPSRP